MSRRLRVGVVGVGAMGRLHAEHLAARVPSACLAAIADVDLTTAREIGERLGVTAYQSLGEMLAETQSDAVLIATPRRYHVPMIIESAAAGKHIFCEKPVASTLEQADEALAAVKASGVVLQIGFHRHFDPGFAAARNAVAGGGVGQVQVMHLTARDPVWDGTKSGRPAEDLVLETTIHDLDMARYVGGSDVESVHALAIPAGEQGMVEGVLLTLRLANGVLATVDNHLRSPYGYDQRIEVFGTGGIVLVENVPANTTRVTDRTGVRGALPLHFFAERYETAYIAELASFVETVSAGGTPQVTGEDGREAVAVAMAALQSLREGRPVTVNR